MALELAVQIIFILCPLLLYSPTSAQQTSLCESKCGDVVISCPFYMNSSNGTSCFHNCGNSTERFKIECRNNQKPFLMSINLEVTGIDIKDNTITVMNPIYNSCEYKSAHVDLRGSTFAYSSQRNKFVAFGCNKIALLSSNESEVGGCASFCDKKEKDKDIKETPSRCLGQYCCETAPASYLIEYNVTIKSVSGNTDNQCGTAMIIDDSLLDYYTLHKIETLGAVPAVLDWMMPITFEDPYNSLVYCVNSSLGPQQGRLCSCYYEGNPYIDGGCTEGNSSEKFTLSAAYGSPKAKWATIIGVFSSLGFISILIAVWWLCKIIKKRRKRKLKEKHFQQNGGLLLQQKLSSSEINVDKTKLFSSKDLEKATDRFNVDRVLGKGGQGTVYKGMLADGKIVAVKKLKVQGNVEDFINEVVILAQINHRNVVKLLGCCLETKFPLLVYEFIPNGTLFDHLHEQNDEFPMTWDMRLRIAIEVSGAVFYLHSAASQPIYHRDIKSTNILLDEKYKAKVADFGASRMVSTVDETHVTTRVQGTFGYLDPEYYHTSQLTEKSDVYSFGVVLVELLTGQKAVSSLRSDGQVKSLASHFMISMDGNGLFDILDDRVLKEGDKEDIMVVAKLAKRCLNMTGKQRPTMREVTMELEGIQNLRKESNGRQDHDEINLVNTDTYVPWETEYSVSVDSLLNSMASSSSDVHPLMHSK